MQNLHLQLQTRGGVDEAIETLTRAYELLGDFDGLADAKTKLLTLQRRLKQGDYVVLEAAQTVSGRGYTTYHYELDDRKELRRGHERIGSVAALAKRLDQPVVVGDTLPEEKREWCARQLRAEGVVAIIEMEV